MKKCKKRINAEQDIPLPETLKPKKEILETTRDCETMTGKKERKTRRLRRSHLNSKLSAEKQKRTAEHLENSTLSLTRWLVVSSLSADVSLHYKYNIF